MTVIDPIPAAIECCPTHGLRHFLPGSISEVFAKLERNLSQPFPGIELVGSAGSFGNQAALDTVVAEICETEPHVVWCVFGARRRTSW